MKIESIDLFYIALPDIADEADGSQDSFVVRIRSDTGLEGFGESDSSPLIAMACYFTPMSHSNIVNLRQCLLGQTIECPEDIRRIYQHARRRALDMAHFPHAYAAADIALWDLAGKFLGKPAWELLGYERALPKRAYASYVFPDTPEQTRDLADQARRAGFTAAKFGWGPMGRHNKKFDVDLVGGARKGLGPDAALMIDAGTVWDEDVDTVLDRAEAFAPFDVTWLEEPLSPQSVEAYSKLHGRAAIPIAAGEGCDTVRAAEDLLVNGKVNFLQIDPGRIGGITPAWQALQLARKHGVTFVNHTFKSHISLAAAIAVLAGEPTAPWVEYCQSGSPLVQRPVKNPICIDARGNLHPAQGPGLGIEVDLSAVAEYIRQVTISVDGQVIGKTGADLA